MFHKVALLASLLCCSLADAAPLGAQSSIDAVFAEHVRAVQARDLPALESTITSGEQLTLILPNGVQTMVGPDFAVLTTKTLYQDTVDGKPYRSRSWVTFTFHKEAGQWRLIHDQNTRLPAEQQ